MNKTVFYSRNSTVQKILDRTLHKYENRYKVKIAANTNHSFDRQGERKLSERQKKLLAQLALKRVAFTLEQVSEVRCINNMPVSIVVDDIVIGVHPKNLPDDLHRKGFGTNEGEGFGVIKTVLSKPNARPNVSYVEGYKVC